jgi:hemolysin activation/secretion protein
MNNFDFPSNLVRKIAFAIIGICVHSASSAQAPNAGALQNQLDLQLERESQAPLVQPPEPKSAPPEKKGEQITFKRIRFEGNTLFTDAQLEQVVKPWIGKPVYISELEDAIVAIQNFYSSKGRIAQASLPLQEIKDGTLLIKILEGNRTSEISTYDTVRASLTSGVM